MFHGTNAAGWLAEGFLIIFQAVPIILAGWYLWERRQKDRARRLRHALLTEIQQTPVDLVSLMPDGNQYLESTIYEANAQKLDLLTNDEIEALINYYTRLSVVRQIVEREGPEIDGDDIPDWQYRNLGSSREDAIETLESNVEDPPIIRKPRSS
jgi:hypothetical protein